MPFVVHNCGIIWAECLYLVPSSHHFWLHWWFFLPNDIAVVFLIVVMVRAAWSLWLTFHHTVSFTCEATWLEHLPPCLMPDFFFRTLGKCPFPPSSFQGCPFETISDLFFPLWILLRWPPEEKYSFLSLAHTKPLGTNENRLWLGILQYVE